MCGALAVVTTAVTFLPWARSGARTRSSYAIVAVVERAGVLTGRLSDLSPFWFFVPALCGVGVVALALARHGIGYWATTSLGLVVAVGGALVVRSPLATEPGAVVGICCGASTTLAGALALATNPRRTA